MRFKLYASTYYNLNQIVHEIHKFTPSNIYIFTIRKYTYLQLAWVYTMYIKNQYMYIRIVVCVFTIIKTAYVS